MALIVEGGALMLRHADIFQARQRSRFMRPDAARYIRPDADRWITPPHPEERKYSPRQPRDWRGRWTDGGGGAGGDSVSPMGQINFGDLPSFSDLFGLFQITPAESDSAGLQLAGVIAVCVTGSNSLTTDDLGNKTFWVTYECAGGRSFTVRGIGHRFPGIVLDRLR